VTANSFFMVERDRETFPDLVGERGLLLALFIVEPFYLVQLREAEIPHDRFARAISHMPNLALLHDLVAELTYKSAPIPFFLVRASSHPLDGAGSAPERP
jgi:hypothetical protein